eukprot:CAMPEP_0115010498 /NCGR_PEP_ID=MMETSP0216-20121206/23353_1 /TAXON_ID=223996 /ORGANISM="Protocruzia adherens, Strain Boccale" /LENGTH=158 /DNA_ID=CAMNT_0002378727 /DNA_START=122 /DNA_END=595 /DNA_ORIENTATION=-
MNEGDVVTVFSQFGEIVDCNLARDEKTGKSRGFAFLAYEDQRSTILAVDNLNGAKVAGRTLRVYHCDDYKPPKKHTYVKDDDEEQEIELYKPSGPDGKSWGKYREMTEEDILEASKQEEEAKDEKLTEEEKWERAFQQRMKEMEAKYASEALKSIKSK